MFKKILIANRGEIACRVIRTARRLGIRTVAVYSDADAGAMHVSMADEACHIGPAPAGESYLRGDLILAAARKSGAQAIHPGYGFLSENAGFARECAAAGIVFIGPPVAAIEAMGSKSAAKRIMEGAKVPLVPGYHGENQDARFLAGESVKIGFPLLIKAAAGGGGKGMRVVSDSSGFDEALAAARREALSSFGDDKVLLERYLSRPRHIEMQVFADSHAHVIHLFERDCSIQRRHQKVLEEAPAPGMTEGLRAKMGEAAVAAARAIGYVGAGTVEFLLDEDGSFYFMEMNTRLQVEHPVTEMITGQDLVEWQLMVAGGEPLPMRQEELQISGHAIEVRIYAEDPSKDFLPATGVLSHLRIPMESPFVRIDTGVKEGDTVSIHYDPMIAKLIIWDRERSAAVRRLKAALAEYQIVGVTTNIEFLATIAADQSFSAAELDTGFIARNQGRLFPEVQPASDRILAVAALYFLLAREAEAGGAAGCSGDPWSPWHRTDGWRLNVDNHHTINFLDNESPVSITAHYWQSGFVLDLPGGAVQVSGEMNSDGDILANLGGIRIKATVVRHGTGIVIIGLGRSHRLTLHDPLAAIEADEGHGGRLTAPMPGKIVSVLVNNGAAVEKGTPLVIMEAMKMEHTISAPRDGVLAEIYYRAGDLVNEGAELLSFEPEGDSA
jgi:3-methylcrotonyl-CoA carboxylase alpha subunit